MGSKTAARARCSRRAGRARHGEPLRRRRVDAALREGARIGYPLLVKAVAGGGGKGMRVVERADELLNAVRTARSEAGSAFGDTAVYFERRLHAAAAHRDPAARRSLRHGRAVRRARVLDPAAPSEGGRGIAVARGRRRSCGARIADGRGTPWPSAAGYTNAGTIEFLLDEDGAFYFLEMNTRLQVEHPVTEMVTSIDLVHWQIRIARGERLTIDPERALTPHGHAIECRIYAEDPDEGFMPSPGLVRGLRAGQRTRHPRRRRRRRRLHGAGVLRLDDREADRLGGIAQRRDRAHGARARASTRCSASGRRSRSSSG